MSILNRVKSAACRVAGRFHIPPELIYTKEYKIMHISDTPTNLYPAVKSLLYVLRPHILIHTGDLADDIKLELDPGCINAYERAISPFLKMLENSAAKEIYLVPGNHDNKKIIKEHIRRSQIVDEGKVLHINGISCELAHSAEKLNGKADYKLYGHNFAQPGGNPKYLNALKNVNIILSPSGNVVEIAYPITVNYDRKIDDCYGIPKAL